MKNRTHKSQQSKVESSVSRRKFLSASGAIGMGLAASALPGGKVMATTGKQENTLTQIPIKDSLQQVWFVTGANRGNGRGIAEAAVNAGHKVVVTARKLSSIPKSLSDNPNVLVAELDVTKQITIDRAVKLAISKFERVDVLVNNAGYGQLGWFENTTEQQVRNQFETNVFGTMNVTRALLPQFRKQRSGYIFTITSVAGLLSVAGSSTYSASKFALEGWMEGLADELKPLGIGVTAIEPGFFRTDFLDPSSAIYAKTEIAEYNPKAVDFIAWHGRMNHHQVGDPAKLGVAVTQLAASVERPLRFVAGTSAIQNSVNKLQAQAGQIELLKQISSQTDGNWSDTMTVTVDQYFTLVDVAGKSITQLNALADLFADDGVLIPANGAAVSGKEAIRKYLTEFYTNVSAESRHFYNTTLDKGQLVEADWAVSARLKQGNLLTLQGHNVFEIAGDGKIRSLKVFNAK
jgi:NAD(P)-dependent dehydrogenase (short-subunit alcohol dehydrogenase family)